MNERPEYTPIEGWENKRQIVQEIPYQELWTTELANKWKTELAELGTEDEPETPIREFDMTEIGLGRVLIKDEGDRASNPTGTMKDRVARSAAASYWTFARHQLDFIENEPSYEKRFLEKHIPRYSMLTSGNAGMALAEAFKNLNLPPPKLLVHKDTNPKIIRVLKESGADIYSVDLSTNPFTGKPSEEDPLSPDQILTLTNNSRGFDLTSLGGGTEAGEHTDVFYYNLAKDVFKTKPTEVYDPFGGGVLHGDIIVTQYLLGQEHEKEGSDNVGSIKILGAEPEDLHSIADKLTAPAKPFIPVTGDRLQHYKDEGFTHPETGVQKVTEAEIKEAWEVMKKYGEPAGMKTEPSGAAGMALYIKRKRAGLVPEEARVVVINTGCGVLSERAA